MVYETPYSLTIDKDDLPSIRVIQAIASLVDAGRGELQPLHSVIDPEALDNMVRSGYENSISFEYEGFHVTVDSDRRIVLRDPESIHTILSTESNILLLAPAADDGDLCMDLLHPYPAHRENVLSVAIDQSVDETLGEWRSRKLETPAEHRIVSLGDFARSAGTQTVTLPGSIEADLISDSHDLSSLLERVENTLSDWQSNPHETVLCFHAIDALLAEIDLDTMFRFFHDFTSRVADSVSVAHYHLDPLECDATDVNALTPLFDAVVYEDGEHITSLGN